MCGCVQLQGDIRGDISPGVCRYEGPALVNESLSMNDIIEVSGVIDSAIRDDPAHYIAATGVVLPFHLHVLFLSRGQHHISCCGVCFMPFGFVWNRYMVAVLMIAMLRLRTLIV